jgi:hypothetical protein
MINCQRKIGFSGGCGFAGPNPYYSRIHYLYVILNKEPMKLNVTTLLIAWCQLFVVAIFGQSTFELKNYHPPVVNAPVFDAQGVPLAGSNYLAELWGAATTDSLAPLQVFDQGGRRLIAPFLSNGYFLSGISVSVPTVRPFGWAWLQVRAWDSRLGSTYEEVAALGIGGYGESPLFYAQGNSPYADPPMDPALLIGLQSFSLRPVPEPSTLGLLSLGGMVLCFAWQRRKAGVDGSSLTKP